MPKDVVFYLKNVHFFKLSIKLVYQTQTHPEGGKALG